MSTDNLIARVRALEAKRVEVRQKFVLAVNNGREDEAAKYDREADRLYHEVLEIKADLAKRGVFL